MGSLSRTKGANAERQVINLLHEQLGVKLKRNLLQSLEGGHDLQGEGCLSDFAIEIKHYAKVSNSLIKQWWQQTTEQAERVNKLPVLIYRGDREAFKVMIEGSLIGGLLEGELAPVNITFDSFCYLVRERA